MKFLTVIQRLVFFLSLLLSHLLNAQCSDVVVAHDGTGDYISIQAAINDAPSGGTTQFIIYIKDGVYDEKLFFEKSNITLIGESRAQTVVTTAVLRRTWRETNTSDWGAATVNIASNVTDLTFANLTIQNNFAEVFPNFPTNNDHTFAIRGGGNRIIILNCDVVTTGGDTLSLWNTNGGMFYHNRCFFEGYVDYVAPRGYCYITDSEFFGYNQNASIWHDGSGGEDHKLVIRNSYFDGVEGFALGRHHKDAVFYLLDCSFSETMRASQGITWTGSDPLQWGERYYYHNTHLQLIDFPWVTDNLETAAASPEPDQVDAFWTFNGEWDPESQIEKLLPFAFLPNIRNQSGCVDLNPTLSWLSGRCVVSHNVYFGTVDSFVLVANTSEPTYTFSNLLPATEYFYRIDEVTDTGVVIGEEWSFWTAESGNQPNQIFNPIPADGADFNTNLTKIDWDYISCSTDSFDVFFGENPDTLVYRGTVKYPGYFFTPSQVRDNTTYYWRVDAKSDLGITLGKVYSFKLNPDSTSVVTTKRSETFSIQRAFPNPTNDEVTIDYQIPQGGEVRILLVDLNGKSLDSLDLGTKPAGTHQVRFVIPDFRGTVFCKLLFEGELSESIRLVVQ